MSFTAEQKRWLSDEIARQMNVVLPGETGGTSADSQSEDIAKMFPGAPTNESRPVMHPYGFASRARRGVMSVVARMGAHLGNRFTIGHRDSERPTDLEEGESAQYSAGGYRIYSRNGGLFVGKMVDGALVLERVVVGDTLRDLIVAMLDEIAAHRHVGNEGFLTDPPNNAGAFGDLKDSYVGEKPAILAADDGRFAT